MAPPASPDAAPAPAPPDPVNWLCPRCRAYFDTNARWIENNGAQKKERLLDLDEIRSLADEGCHLCGIICQAVLLAANPGHVPGQAYRQADESKIRLMDVSVAEDELYHGFQMTVSFWFDDNMDNDVASAQIFLDPVVPHEDHLQTQGMEPIQEWIQPKLENSTGSATTTKQIEEWITASAKMQAVKRWGRDSLPARLLDIGPHPEDDILCLVSTDSLPEDSVFMTLSYCWGSKAFLKLTKLTSKGLVDGMKISKLPKTFQDAIELTRKLGIRFLWIDALCIQQDSEEDFAKEARGMANLYQRSYLNIAAIDSSDCTGGLYRTRTSRSALPCLIQPTWSCFANKKKLYAYHRGHYEEVTNKPFFCRGWILQELILSSRIVSFGESQIFWMSQSGYASEAFPHFLPRLRNNIVRKNIYQFTHSHVYNPQKPDFKRPLFIWSHILDSYNKKRLSYSRDKMIALAGLADYMSAATKGTLGRYVMGSWETALSYQLGWRIRDEYQRPHSHRNIPSFSWAIIDCEPGGVEFPSIQVEEVDRSECLVEAVFPADQPPSAVPSVSSCMAIKIRGPFETVTCENENLIGIGSTHFLNPPSGSDTTSHVNGWKIYWDRSDDSPALLPGDLKAVLLSEANSNERVALLLKKVAGECCRYSRVGLLKIFGDFRPIMVAAFKRPGDDGSMCESEHSVDGNRGYWTVV